MARANARFQTLFGDLKTLFARAKSDLTRIANTDETRVITRACVSRACCHLVNVDVDPPRRLVSGVVPRVPSHAHALPVTRS